MLIGCLDNSFPAEVVCVMAGHSQLYPVQWQEEQPPTSPVSMPPLVQSPSHSPSPTSTAEDRVAMKGVLQPFEITKVQLHLHHPVPPTLAPFA